MNLIRKNILFLCCFLFLGTIVHAQNTIIDSLLNELTIHVQKDSLRVKLYNKIADKNYGVNQEKFKEYAEEARTLAKEIGYLNGEARGSYLVSVYYLSKGDMENATSNITISLDLYKKDKDILGTSSCYDLMGTISNMKEDYDKSIIFFKKALKIANDQQDAYKKASFLSNIGGAYSRMGEFDKAIKNYKEAIAIYDSLNLKNKVLIPLSNIASIYSQQGRNLEALEYFQKCLTINKVLENKIFSSNILLNMGTVYINIGDYNKALTYVQKSLELNKELGNEFNVSKSYISLGDIYHSKNEYKKALDYYNKALTISNKIESKEVKYISYNRIGNLHFQGLEYALALINLKKGLKASLALGGKFEIAESYVSLGATYYELQNYEIAQENIIKGIVIADELSVLKTQERANLFLSKIYEKKKDYKAALYRYRLHKVQSDSLSNKENIRKITQIEYDYKYKQELDAASTRESKLTNEVNTASEELEKSQRSLLLGVIAFLIMALILGTIIFFLKLRNEKSNTQNIAIEQKLLRSQMTPHFIFNALSVLQGIILNKEEEKAVSYLSKFSKLLRIILENSREKTVLLSQELVAVESYLSLQNLEETKLFNFKITVDENIDENYFNIPPMLIQPFIENAIEHAFGIEKKEKNIDIHLSYKENKLICTIVDDGIGIHAKKENSKNSKKSFATAITSERLSLLSKDFETKGSIQIVDRKKYNEKGTIVTLVIPYKINVAS